VNSNLLTAIPPGIGKLKKLENLQVNNNQLTDLPIEIKNLPKLKAMSYENNQFSPEKQIEIDKLYGPFQVFK